MKAYEESQGETRNGLLGAAALFEAAGTPAFPQTLFQSLKLIDHAVTFTFTEPKGFDWLFTTGEIARRQAVNLADRYVDTYNALDPNRTKVLAARHGAAPGFVSFNRHRIGSRRYWEFFFKRPHLADKVSLIFRHEKTHYYCNLYRLEKSGRFSDSEIDFLRAVTPLLAAALTGHAGAGDRHSDRRRRRTFEPAPFGSPDMSDKELLSEREIDVCRRILLGFSTEAIALDLDLGIDTVKTYRKRAYRKLGISSLNELHFLNRDRHLLG